MGDGDGLGLTGEQAERSRAHTSAEEGNLFIGRWTGAAARGFPWALTPIRGAPTVWGGGAAMSESHQAADAIGRVTHYYSHLSVAAISLSAPLRVGERIHLVGHTTDLVQAVESLEIDRARVNEAGAGDDVALQVAGHVREHDLIFREA